MSEDTREIKHWFTDGAYRSARLLGKFNLTVEVFDEDPDAEFHRTSMMRGMKVRGIEDLADYVVSQGFNGETICIMSANVIVPESHLADTKEEAFHNYVQRMALEHGISQAMWIPSR